MDTEEFKQQISAYAQWKSDLITSIQNYDEWLDDNDMADAEISLRLIDMLDALKSDHITIAFVAEVSSGKTELINSIFFADYKRRLLPSDAGRTTMCPTELMYDKREDTPYIRLLPIETRLEDVSINEYKRSPSMWTKIELDISSADSLAETLKEVTAVKMVPIAEAKRLRLFDDWLHSNTGDGNHQPTEVEIPRWRHALVSFPHPLLEQGLIVLDTPGLNSLGSEPELTLNMLPNAQAVLFLLAADTGVTKSELDMWKNHIQPYRSAKKKGLLVVLNKIDTMWDELKSEEAYQQTLADQVQKTAKMLNVPKENVFPVSAQKALVAKIKNDTALLEKSGVPALQNTLMEDILPVKHAIIRDNVVADISGMVGSSLEIIKNRLSKVDGQFQELESLSGKNKDVIQHLLNKTREEQNIYLKNVESLQKSRRALSQNANAIMKKLSPKSMDKLVALTRNEMSKSWTTAGMKKGMSIFFDSIRQSLTEASEQADRTHKLVHTIYRMFHEKHGFADIKPKIYTTKRYQQLFDLLYEEADLFRSSPMTTMTEQSFVVKKFFITLVSQARNIFFNSYHDAEKWAKTVMSPLITQVRDHKKEIEKRLETLRKISESRETLKGKMAELETTRDNLNEQRDTLQQMLDVFNRPLTKDSSDEAA